MYCILHTVQCTCTCNVTICTVYTCTCTVAMFIVSNLHVCTLLLGLDNRNIDNRYQYSTFSDIRYHDQISICTYAYEHSVKGICFF